MAEDTKKTSRKRSAKRSFRHPALGACVESPRYLAVFWTEGATPAQKQKLLKELKLQLASVADSKGPAANVNQTDRLSWVAAAGNKTIGKTAADGLSSSDIVEWTSRCYSRDQGRSDQPSYFALNPTRIYLREAAMGSALAATELHPGLAKDNNRSAHLHGLMALTVGDEDVIDVAQSVNRRLAREGAQDQVRFETIPFLSPACHANPCAVPTSAYAPNDSMFGDQWGLQRTEVPRAWQMVRGGDDVTVAVIDEGVQLDHPDLLLHPQSWNASTDTADGSPTGNHGTACAGIAAARMDNGEGVAGVAGGCRTMAIATATWADVDIAEGLYFAADNGAQIVSMSFGVYESWGFWDFDLIRDALQYAHDKGLVLIAASGNENGNVARFPGSDSRTLCVGGSNRSDERKRVGDSSSESWWGASFGPDVDVCAPCLEMPTTDRLGSAGYDAGDYFGRFNGTSSATPLVAGIAALLLRLRPGLSNVDVRSIIERTCDKISPAIYTYANTLGKPSGTWNEEVGYGRVNAERALLEACSTTGEEGSVCEGCDGCGDCCVGSSDADCIGPRPVPWQPYDRCQFFYEGRVFSLPIINDREPLRIRVIYQHCLKLIGRQQGPLLYTTTLLPGEKVRLYEFDRYRRVRSETQRVSVHSSFRQTLSSLSQTRRALSASAYTDVLNQVRTEADSNVSVGGGLAGFFGAPKGSISGEFEQETSIASGASVSVAAEQFTQLAITASQAIEAERSLVISSFEDEESRSTTQRTLKNHNHCHAVTYFVRRVNELYEVSTRVESVEWQLGNGGPWRSFDEVDSMPGEARKILETIRGLLPRKGDVTVDARPITLPTDGTLYEAELAHCSSCEPVVEAMQKVKLEKQRLEARRACLEADLLEMEIERRRALIGTDREEGLVIPGWDISGGRGSAAALETGDHGD